MMMSIRLFVVVMGLIAGLSGWSIHATDEERMVDNNNVAANSELAPIIFLPGYLGNVLEATITDAAAIPQSCAGLVPVGVKFSVLYNATLLLKNAQCVYDLLELDYDVDKSPQFFGNPSIKISGRDFGGFGGIEVAYASFLKQLQAWGYTVHKDAFGAPYDYRYMSPDLLSAVGLIDSLKQLVETAYHRNGKRRVVLVGHSNGGPTMYSFVSAMPQLWKDTYVAGIVGLSGNFLGQMNCVKAFIDTSATSLMMSTWEAQYMSMPWGDYAPVTDIPIVISHTSDGDVSYTAKVGDLSALFNHLNRPDWTSRLQSAAKYMNRSQHPNVNTYCFYGQKLNTSFAFEFPGDVASGGKYTTYHMEGDGNQDLIDQQFCENVWGAANSKYITQWKGFDGVHHMQMYSDENVLAALHDVLMTAK
jgi:pimeloyl-ACP methyl ester carboxylesterase